MRQFHRLSRAIASWTLVVASACTDVPREGPYPTGDASTDAGNDASMDAGPTVRDAGMDGGDPDDTNPHPTPWGIFSLPAQDQDSWGAVRDLGVSNVRLQFRMGEPGMDIAPYSRVFDQGVVLWLTLYHRDPSNVPDPDLLGAVPEERGGYPFVDEQVFRDLVRRDVATLADELRDRGQAPGDWLVIQFGNEVTPSDVVPPRNEAIRFWHGTADEYLDALRVTYEVVKDVDPSIRVAAGGIASEAIAGVVSGLDPDGPSTRWNERLLAEGRYDFADVHLYNLIQDIPAKIEWMLRHTTMPVVSTEIGGPDEDALEPYSEEGHAADLSLRLCTALEAGASAVYWTTLVDGEAFGERFGPMALIERDGRRKPAFAAYVDLIDTGCPR